MVTRHLTDRIFCSFVCMMLAGFTWGCGSKNDGRVPVYGEVKLDGQPLPTGTVSFLGDQGFAVAVGDIKNGKYSVNESGSRQGIPSGVYQVRITSWIDEPGKELPTGGFSEGKSAIPKRYQEGKTSGLTAEVQPGNAKKFDFELNSK